MTYSKLPLDGIRQSLHVIRLKFAQYFTKWHNFHLIVKKHTHNGNTHSSGQFFFNNAYRINHKQTLRYHVHPRQSAKLSIDLNPQKIHVTSTHKHALAYKLHSKTYTIISTHKTPCAKTSTHKTQRAITSTHNYTLYYNPIHKHTMSNKLHPQCIIIFTHK